MSLAQPVTPHGAGAGVARRGARPPCAGSSTSSSRRRRTCSARTGSSWPGTPPRPGCTRRSSASTGIERNLIWVLFAHDGRAPADRRLGHPRPPGARRVPRRHDRRPPRRRDGRARRAGCPTVSAEFRAWWPEHDVARFETRLRRFDHPRAGMLTFEYQQLTPAEWPACASSSSCPCPATTPPAASPSATTRSDRHLTRFGGQAATSGAGSASQPAGARRGAAGRSRGGRRRPRRRRGRPRRRRSARRRRRASTRPRPLPRHHVAKPAVNASPAPIVSTTGTGGDGHGHRARRGDDRRRRAAGRHQHDPGAERRAARRRPRTGRRPGAARRGPRRSP